MYLTFLSQSIGACMVSNGIPFQADHKPYRGFTRCRCAQSLISNKRLRIVKATNVVFKSIFVSIGYRRQQARPSSM